MKTDARSVLLAHPGTSAVADELEATGGRTDRRNGHQHDSTPTAGGLIYIR
jgi:hypothetical protein